MRFPILASYAYARKPTLYERGLQYWYNRPDVDILLDSGAFTAYTTGAEIKLDDYLAFLERDGSKLWRYIALDVISNPQASDDNLRAMLAAGFKPAAVHVLGDDQRRMDELFEMSDLVCLGGLLRPGKGHASKAYVKAIMDWARGRQTHWLGFVRVDLFRAFRPTSADSNSWNGAARYGGCSVYIGGGRWLRVHYDTRHKLLTSKIAMHFVRRCGYTARQLDDPRCWRELEPAELNATVNITADSWVRYVVDLYKRFGVRVFLAIRMHPHEHVSIGHAIDRHAAEIAAAQPPEVLSCSPSSA